MNDFTKVASGEKTNVMSLCMHLLIGCQTWSSENYNLKAEHKVAQVDKVASGKKGHVTDCVSCVRLSNILKQWKIT